MPVIEGAGLNAPVQNAGAPVAGTDEVQTTTIGGSPETNSKFRLSFDGWITAYITWSNVNATLLTAIQTALNALPNVGASGVATAAGTLTAGIGTLTVTFNGGNVTKRAVPTLVTVDFLKSDNTASAGTCSTVETTPGVTPTALGMPKGGLLTDTTNGKLYINTGTAAAPTWTVVGAQS